MELTHWKGGGVAGSVYSQRLGPCNVGKLAKPQARRISELVMKSRFFHLPNRLPDTGTIIDGLQYRMKIEEEGQANQVEWTGTPRHQRSLRNWSSCWQDLKDGKNAPWKEWHEAAPS